MRRSVRCMASLILVLPFFVASALVVGAQASEQGRSYPDRVTERCGAPPYAAENLCNVDDGLVEAFLLVEAVADDAVFPDAAIAIPERVIAVVREHHVTVEWYPGAGPEDLRPGLLGMYEPGTRRVLLPPALSDEPVRVRAAVLAHELGHASWDVDGLGAELRPRAACVATEMRAYRIGLEAYARALRVAPEPEPPAGNVDALLSDDVALWHELSGGSRRTARALDDLANRHIFGHGYDESCSWR